MALTLSTMLPLGTPAFDFNLLEPSTGRYWQLHHIQNESGFLIMFICNHCPYVKHIRYGIAELAHDYIPKGLKIVAINSNDVVNYPDDSPEKMIEEVKTVGYIFPYLYDETQEVAKAYQAVCTPEFYLFDGTSHLVYRGRFDDSSPGKANPVTGADLRQAIDALLNHQPISSDQKPSMGCNIKWRASE